MSLPVVDSSQFESLVLKKASVLDVRAPVEFLAGSIPGSVNYPILNDQERNEIGTLYKEKGQAAAIERGHQLVSGEIRESRIQSWKQALLSDPEMVITCFRGGKRSQITQAWLKESGVHRPRIDGGYKAFRNYLLTELDRLSEQKMIVISGATGSGKTLLVREALKIGPTLDLEAYARHRGSAFGGYPSGQPSQVDFENKLACELIRLQQPEWIVVEDESRLIGRCAQPEKFFQSLRASGIVFLEEPLNVRVQITFEDYILNSELRTGDPENGLAVFNRYQKSLASIQRKLGGLLFSEIQKDLTEAQHVYFSTGDLEPNRVWIEKLLRDYYDPMYFGSIAKRNPPILFRGTRAESVEWLKNHAFGGAS